MARKKVTKREKKRIVSFLVFSLGGVFLFSAFSKLINGLNPLFVAILGIGGIYLAAKMFELA